MKWFQQNRELGMLLIGFAVGTLLIGALFYWRWSVWTEARQTFDQAAGERGRLAELDTVLNEPNFRKLQGYVKDYSTALDQFKQTLKLQMVPAPPLAPNDFQSRLRLVVVATLDRARANNVKLPDNFQLGFDEFAKTMPDTAITPLLGQELSQIQKLMNIVVDAKVDSVTSLHRVPLAAETKSSPTPAPSPAGRAAAKKPAATPAPPLIERNVVDITFKAAPSAARRVLNEIAATAGQFCIIRTLYVHNEKDKGPARERTASPTPASPPPLAGAGASPAPTPGGPLNFIVGTEHIEVSATIEMLRFTF